MQQRLKRSTIWLRVAISAGCLLGLLLLLETVATYVFVSHRLIEEEAEREANRVYTALMEMGRISGLTDLSKYGPYLERERVRELQRVAWIRMSSMDGKVLAVAGDPAGQKLPSVDRLFARANLHESVTARESTALGPVWIVVSRFRAPRGPRGPEFPGPRPDGPGFNHPPPGAVLEVAIYLDRVSLAFGPLQHNLIIGCLAALALLGSMILIAVLLKRHARARELERQLELAEGVQRDLLPRPDLFSALACQFAAVSIPSATVGGDFHDVLQGEGGRLSLVLGDVSGKGLSAALLMGVIHGAVRSADWTTSVEHHEAATERLNRLLCEKTAHERFASLFWCCFDPQTALLRYVNAGHLPPLLVHSSRNGSSIEHLNQGGGPVLGLLPAARFESSEIHIHPGDLLVIYSDGILEALNQADEEFGEDRIAQSVSAISGEDPTVICDAVLKAIQRFLGPLKPHDDQTLMVVRLMPLPTN